MPQHSLTNFGQWFADFGINNGIVTTSPWFTSDNGVVPVSDLVVGSAPMATNATVSGSVHAQAATTAGSALGGTLNVGVAGASVTPGPTGETLITNATSFTGGIATATSGSDLNALIIAADSQTSAGTLTIDISGSLALNTLPAVADGEILSGGTATAVPLTHPDIAAINLHSGVSLVIAGSNNAVLDGGNTGTNAVRGLFAYAGNVTINNLTIQNTTAQGGAGANAGFAGGGGAGLGGGLFVGANANVTLNSVSFSGNKAIGGAGGNNTGGASAGFGGGGGLGGNGGFVDGNLYFGGGGGVGRTAFGGNGSTYAVNDDHTSSPGPGIIIGGASGGNGAKFSATVGGSQTNDNPTTTGAVNGGGGGEAEGTSGVTPYHGSGSGGGGVGGHAGYSYESSYDSKKIGGGGGVGGFGGGGGAGYYYGGNGGFGGGAGGGEYKYGANGGFGGGGGGIPNSAKTLGQGGFGAGNAGGGPNIGNGRTPKYALSGGDAGGGGLGAGGAVFVQGGGILTLGGAGTVAAGTVAGGAGGIVSETDGNGTGTTGTAGSAFGNDIFIQNNSTSVVQGITFAPGSGHLLTLTGVIADEKGSGGTGANATQGKVVVQGGGTIRLTGSNTFQGGVSVSASSTLDLGGTRAAGPGEITLGTGSNDLILESAAITNGTTFSNGVSGFDASDEIDLSGLTFHAGATALINNGTLTVISSGTTDTVLVPGVSSLSLTAVQDAGSGTLAEVHSAPTVTASGTVTFNGGGSPVVANSGLTITDPSSTTLVSAEVIITNTPLNTDTLAVGTPGGLTIAYNSGTLTLSGTASVAIYQTALDSVTFGENPSNSDPTNGNHDASRTLSWSVNDGILASNTATTGVATQHVAPTVAAGATVTYAAGGTPVVLDSGLTVTDPDSGGNLVGATITISTGEQANDALNFVNQGGITGSYGGGTLTLTGTAAVSTYQTALESITYSFSGSDPAVGGTDNSRGISWTVNDGAVSNTAVTSTVNEHDAPVITTGGTVTFQGGGAAVPGDLGATVSDASSTTLASAKVVISSGFLSGDTLTVASPGGLSTAYSNGTLTLTGSATLATYQTALESVKYGFTANADPTNDNADTVRTLSWSVNDGTLGSNIGTSTVDTTHTAPHVGAGGTATFDGGGSAVALDPGLTASDVDSNGVLSSATVTVVSPLFGDTLNFTNSHPSTEGNIAVASDIGGALVLTSAGSTATVLQWETALESVTYSFTPDNGDPTAGGANTSRTIDWTVNDGVANSNTATSTLNTVHVNPTVTASGTVSYVSGGSPVVLDASVTASDPDSGGDLIGATVTIGTGFASGDTLNFTNQNGILGSVNNGTLTLTGLATIPQYDAALASITYSFSGADSTVGGTDDSRVIDWSVSDRAGTSTTATSTVDVSTTHNPPVVTAGATATFNGGEGAVIADAGLTVTDSSSSTLASAQVVITSGFNAGDVLSVATPGGLTVGYNSGTLTLSGTASLATYDTALDSLTFGFSPTDGDPTAGVGDTSRTLSWSVNDGVAASNSATSTVTVIHVAPTVAASGSVSYTGGGSPVTIDPTVTTGDPDSGNNLTGATIKINSGFAIGDQLNFTNQNGITGSLGNGTLTLTGTATVLQYQAALESITYSFAGGDPTVGGSDDSRTINWTVTDGVASSIATNSTVTVSSGAGTPSIAAPGTVTLGIGQSLAISPVSIAESPTTGGETFTAIVSDNHGILSANTGATNGGGTITPSNGNKTLTISGTLAQVNADLTTLADTDSTTPSDTITYSLSDSDSGTATPASTAVTVNSVPVITSAPGSVTVTQSVATGVTPITVGELGNTTTSGETFSVVVTDGAGVLSANTTAPGGGGTISPSGTTLTISGTLAQVNADLSTLADDDASTAADTITVAASDSFGNSTATATTIPVTVTPGSGTPSISAPATATVGVNQTAAITTVSISESPTTGGEMFTVALSDTTGLLSATTTVTNGGGSISGSGGNLLFISGTLTQVNADLTTLTDDDGTAGADTITVTAHDSNGGTAAPAPIIVSVNSAPSISAPASATVAQNVATAVTPVGVSETGNTTASGEMFTVVATDSAGVLSANTTASGGGGTISPSGTTLTISGTLAQVNADLSTLADDDASTASDTITVTASDSFGNSTASATTIPVTVVPAGPTTATFDAHVYVDSNGDGSQDDGESNLAFVNVDLLNASGIPTGTTAITDSNGNVSFTGLTPGTYEIGVVTPVGDGVSQATNVNTPNTLAPGQTANATEGVYVPVTFSVHVYDDVNADGTQDAGDSNLQGVTVNLLDGSGNPTGKSSSTDSNGNASFTGLAPGAYEISVITPSGDVASQSVNLNTPNTLASGGSANATEGLYAPPALSQATIDLSVAEGHSLGNLWSELIANGVDPNPGSLTITAVGTSGTQGSVTLNSGTQSLVYIATGLNPLAPVDAFTYTLKDGSGGTVTGTVDVTVTGPTLPTTVDTTPGSTATATGSGQRLIAEGAGQTLVGSSAGGDELFGGPDTTIAAFGAGNTIFVEPGNHSIAMGTNNNTVTLYNGNNTVTATGTGNTVNGGNGNNHISGMTGSSTITLGNGNNSISITGANNSITVGTGTNTISAGTGGNETVVAGGGANTISGGGAGDSFTAGNGANKITATGANATIIAGNGGDTVLATGAGDNITTGGGNDSIQVTAGSATIKAGLGINTIKFAGSSNDVINQGGTDTLTDTGTNNTIVVPLAGQGLDTTNGSVLANGDTFDLRSALAATTWDQQLSDLGDYLSLGTSGSNTLVQLSVTSDGTPITIAVLNGQGSVTLSSFVSHALLT
jgi:hypothetical protein